MMVIKGWLLPYWSIFIHSVRRQFSLGWRSFDLEIKFLATYRSKFHFLTIDIPPPLIFVNSNAMDSDTMHTALTGSRITMFSFAG